MHGVAKVFCKPKLAYANIKLNVEIDWQRSTGVSNGRSTSVCPTQFHLLICTLKILTYLIYLHKNESIFSH